MKIYVNGFLEVAAASVYHPGSLEPLIIGSYLGFTEYGQSESYVFHGDIDEIRIWNCARTETEIRANMGGTLTGQESGLAAYWPFDGDTGAEVLDRSPNGNNGVRNGNAVIVASDFPTLETVTLLVPDLISPSNNAAWTGTSLTCSWNTVPNATSYRIQVSTDPTFQVISKSGSPSAATATISGLSPSTTYYWRVYAVAGISRSEWSEVRSFTTAAITLPKASTSWNFVGTFTNLTGSSGIHGLAVDPEGKIWIAIYGTTENVQQIIPPATRATRAIYIYYPNGQPASFSPIKIISVNGTNDTLYNPSNGLSTDPNGNILYVTNSTLYKLDYRTGVGMAKVIPQGFVTNVSLTAPATDQAGNVFIGRVYPSNAVMAFDPSFNFVGNITNASTGYSRTIGASRDGRKVYWPEFDTRKLYRFDSPTGVSGPYTNSGVMLDGLAIESMTWHPKTGFLWVSSGSDANPPSAPYPIMTWYALDPNNMTICDTIGWYPTDGTLTGRPRAIAFSPTADTAYVGCFSINSNFVQMFVRKQEPNLSAFSQMRLSYAPSPSKSAVLKIASAPLTVEAWVYPVTVNPGGNLRIVSNVRGGIQDDNYSLFASTETGEYRPGFSIASDAPGSKVAALAADPLPRFQWSHVAGTYDGSMIRVYVNGELKAETPASITISTNVAQLYVAYQLYGAIDEARIWNTLRTQSQIQDAMRTQLIGTEPGLLGYWRMNYLVGGKAADQTSNGNHLTLSSNAKLIAFNPFTTYGPPTYSCQTPSIDFGTVEVASNVNQTIRLTNTGPSPLLGVFVPSSNLMSYGVNWPFFIEPGATSDLGVAFRPLQSGVVTGSVQIAMNSSLTSTVFVQGTCLPIGKIFDANNAAMWVLRDGRFAYNPISSWGGFEWPKGTGKTAIYESGLWIGAKVNTQLRTATAGYQSDFQAGPIISGTAPNPMDSVYRVYKVKAGDNASTNHDYANWPVAWGAPVNEDGSPQILGDQTLFTVYNDLNQAKHYPFASAPLGAEVQQTTFGSNAIGARSNSVILRFKIINKSAATWNDTYVALWSDPDLGNWADDFVAVDVNRDLGYVYNATNADTSYDVAPPAIGYDILKGAFHTKPIQGFSYYSAGEPYPYQDPRNATEAYNFMNGKLADGTSYVDPTNSLPTTFALSGDPVTGTGWIDSNPGDRRFLFSTGPFTLEPGQSKEIIAAIVVGKGSSNINSITELRAASDEIQTLFDNGQLYGGSLQNVATVTAPAGTTATLSDLSNSGTELIVTGGTGGALVELATYIEPPPGSPTLRTPVLSTVNNYLDVDVMGTVQWPIVIKQYYTASDLEKPGAFEDELQGIYYWSTSANMWNLYANSGLDDQTRGPSTTWVDTTNIVVNGVHFEGIVYANAYHLTPMVIGVKKKTAEQRFAEFKQITNSLPDASFKKPAVTRRTELVDKLERSRVQYASGNVKAAVQTIQGDILNHLTSKKNLNDLWVTDEKTGQMLVRLINELLIVIQRPVQGGTIARFMSPQAESDEVALPTSFGLKQNFPNPFNPSTTIRYQIPEAAHVVLKVYNMLGEVVATLVDNQQSPGYYLAQWTPQLSSGMYIYRLQAGKSSDTKRLVFLK